MTHPEDRTHLLKALGWLLLAVVLAGLAVMAEGQEAKPVLPHVNWAQAASSGLLADAAARSLDTYSTHYALTHGCRELFLPDWISHHPAAMAGYGAAVVGTDAWAARRLARRGHPRLAKLVPWVDAAQDGFWAVHNLTIGKAGKVQPVAPVTPVPPRLPRPEGGAR